MSNQSTPSTHPSTPAQPVPRTTERRHDERRISTRFTLDRRLGCDRRITEANQLSASA